MLPDLVEAPETLPCVIGCMATWKCGHSEMIYGMSRAEIDCQLVTASEFSCVGCWIGERSPHNYAHQIAT